MSTSTSFVSVSSTGTLTLAVCGIIQTFRGPPAVLKTVSMASIGGGQSFSSLARLIGIKS